MTEEILESWRYVLKRRGMKITLFEHMNFLQGYFKVRRVLNH